MAQRLSTCRTFELSRPRVCNTPSALPASIPHKTSALPDGRKQCALVRDAPKTGMSKTHPDPSTQQLQHEPTRVTLELRQLIPRRTNVTGHVDHHDPRHRR